MVHILIVEDNKTNAKLFKLLVEGFAKENFESYEIDIVENGFEAIGILMTKNYDLMFLDVKLPKYDGVSVLTTLQSLTNIHLPYICMATSLGEEKFKLLYQLKGANAYLIKPIHKEKLHIVMSKALAHKIKIVPSDDFFDFDEDFLDLEDENDSTTEAQRNKIEKANLTHANVSAQEFLSDINVDDYMDNLDSIEELYLETKDKITVDSFFETKYEIIDLLSKYASFLNNFPEFYEISYSLHSLHMLLNNLDIKKFSEKHQDFIITYISSLLEDIYEWKVKVFDDQETIDVFYINASSLSNCIQLQNFLNKEMHS